MAIKIITPVGDMIDLNEFAKKYSAAYIYGNEKIENIRYLQTWEPIEQEILDNHDIFQYELFKRMMAWKFGRIAYKRSFREKRPCYYKDWINEGNKNPRMRGNIIELAKFHRELLNNKPKIDSCIENDDIESAINAILACWVPGSYIGAVYAITILFFMSEGKYPIYDRFVLTSLKAIEEKRYPKVGESKQYHNMNKEEIIKTYINYYIPKIDVLLEKMNIKPKNHLEYRDLDRALWVYGHGY